MKLVKPTEKSATNIGLLLVGVVLGGVVSKVGYGLVHDPNAGTTTDEKTKNKMFGYLKRGGLAAGGGALAASVNGDDALATILKGAGIGMAGVQTLEGVGDFAAGNAQLSALTASPTATKLQKALGQGLGLKCPCGQSSPISAIALNRAVSRYQKNRGMKGINLPGVIQMDQNMNSGFFGVAS